MSRSRAVRRLPVWIWFLPLILPIALLLLAPSLARIAGGGFYSQPSTSMEPTLPKGSAYLTLPLSPGGLPERGQIVVFEHPTRNGVDYVKRVIGLPGDRVAMRDGVPILNGAPARHETAGDAVVRSSTQVHLDDRCYGIAGTREWLCTLRRVRETLPGGKSYFVLDAGLTQGDNLAEILVPEGHVFALGDHRDNSLDSRHSQMGSVPVENLRSAPWRFYINLHDPRASLPLFLDAVDEQG